MVGVCLRCNRVLRQKVLDVVSLNSDEQLEGRMTRFSEACPRRFWYAVPLIILIVAGPCSADHVARVPPQTGQAATYSLTGTGAGQLTMPGSGQGLPLSVDIGATIRRSVTTVSPQGVATIDQAISDQRVAINGQDVTLGSPPHVTSTVDASGAQTSVAVGGNGHSGLSAVTSVQPLLTLWSLAPGDYKVGQSWTVPTQMASATAGTAGPGARVAETYAGIKKAGGKASSLVKSHLVSPVVVPLSGGRKLAGFSVTAVSINAMDQDSYFDPATGGLLSSQSKLDVSVDLKMGDGADATAMTVRMPLTIKTQLEPPAPADATTKP